MVELHKSVNRWSLVALIFMLFLTIYTLILTIVNVSDTIVFQWLYGAHWAPIFGPHNGFIFINVLAGAISLVSCCAIIFFKRKIRLIRACVLFFGSLLVCIASFLPIPATYAAIAVYVLGPGNNSQYLQTQSAVWDSPLLLRALISKKVKLDDSILVFASGYDSPAVVTALISEGWDVNARRFLSRRTALHTAVKERQYIVASLLVKAGARIDIPNAKGVTSMESARLEEDDKMVEILSKRRK